MSGAKEYRPEMDKTWRILAVYSTGKIIDCDVWAGTIYVAFERFYTLHGEDSLVEIHITEVTDDERSKGIPDENPVV